MRINKHKVKTVLLTTIWLLAGCGTLMLLVAAAEGTGKRECAGIHVRITGVSNNFFVDQQDVQNIISTNTGNVYRGKAISNIDLRSIEKVLLKEVWIKKAELYFDNNNILQAEISEREPVVRVFTSNGTSYYIDSSLMMLPLSEKFSARLPVVTGFPTDVRVLTHRDSLLLDDVREIGMYIMDDPFLMAMIDQVDITPQRTFEMLPKIGNQLIILGDASNLDEKFNKLKLLYKNIITKTGWGKYSQVNLQYDNQVVCKVRGKEDVLADSLRTKMLMQLIAETTERMASDSVKLFLPDSDKVTDSTIVMESLQRDEVETEPEINVPTPKTVTAAMPKVELKSPVLLVKPVTKPPVKKVNTIKPVVTKPVIKNNSPKAVMPKRNT